MKFLKMFILVSSFIFTLTAVSVVAQTITVSTNNTPLDRKVLKALSREAFSRISIDFKLVSLPSERSLKAANVGEIDGEGLRVGGLSNRYPNLIQVPERYVGISFVAFSKDATIKINGWNSLTPYRIGFITGWKMFEAKASGARVVQKVDTPEQLFKMLNAGRIDLALYTKADGMVLIRKDKYTAISPLMPSLKDVDLFLYLNKKHAPLVDKLAAAIREIKADGTYNEILSAINIH